MHAHDWFLAGWFLFCYFAIAYVSRKEARR